jgi:glycosyltransferase involved in cell wall biosynthesis
MKIALVVHDYDANFGQGRYCVELVRHLHGRANFVIYSNTFRGPLLPDVTWRHVPAIRYNALTTVFSFLPAAECLLRRDRPDLIHAQGLTGWSSDIITGHICNAARGRRLRTQDRRPHLFIKLVTPFERAFYRRRRARHLIAISQALAREMRVEYGWQKATDVIYHGTNLEQFRPVACEQERANLRIRYGIPLANWTWLFMGEAVKGLQEVIEQLPFFPQAHLLVVTRSDLRRFRQLADSLSVGKRITFHGFEPNSEEAFRAADVFVYPNDYDPFGMVAAEAMATGIAVVVGRTIGAAELVRHGVNGLLCEPHDAGSIRAQLSVLASDKSAARAMGMAARDTVAQHTWSVCAEQTWAVYQQVLQERFPA